jgi:para-nitrobenzyl esterase
MDMKYTTAFLAGGAALMSGVVAYAQPAAEAPRPPGKTAVELLPAPVKLTVTTPAFQNGADIPYENTQYRGNVFPGLKWTAGPRGTQSYAIIMQDSTYNRNGAALVHWSMFNLPGSTTSLPAGMAPDAKPAGSSYGVNYKGPAQPYTGPRTPPGRRNNSHFAVFALDTRLPDNAGESYETLTKAMEGHVLASGEIVGIGQRDPTAPPDPPRPARPAQ